MSGFNHGCPYINSTATGTVTQGPELAAPHLDANAPPFAQTIRPHHQGPTQSSQSHDFSGYHSMQYAPVQQHQIRPALPSQYSQEQSRRPEHQTIYTNAYPYTHPPAQIPAEPPVPRRGAFCPDVPSNPHPNMTWFGGVGSMSTMPSQPTMGERPGTTSPLRPSWREDSATSNSGFTEFLEQTYMPPTQQPPAGWFGGYGQATSPVRASPPRQAYSIARRSAQQTALQYNSSLYRAFTGRPARHSNTQGRPPVGDDMPRAVPSPNAEEAIVRGPPSHRSRRLPREARMRYSNPAQYHDPNLATSRQVQELKDKLPRRLPCELPEGTSNTCDICAKDYSCTPVQPCEGNEVAIELPCGHCFGEFCIFEWVRITFCTLQLRIGN
jgi:hypothetical protein